MPTILQILPKLYSGGVERGTIEIAKAIIAEGYNSIVISSGGKMVPILEKTGSKHITMDVASKNPLKIWLNSFKIRKIIKELNVDIVHARSRVPAWSAYLACKNTKAKFMTTFHGVYSGKSAFKKKYNALMLKGEKIITVSNFIKAHIKENYNVNTESKLTVIHRGVDLDEFNEKRVQPAKIQEYINKWHLPDDKKIILLPGRITEWKGQSFFIDALSKVKNDDYFALIVGDDSKHFSYRKSLEEQIKQYGLEGKIAIQEAVPDLVNLYQLSDLVISTSLRPEAFGRTIVEAGAMAKIIIATKHGGACETVIDGKTGYLIESDNVDEFAKKIEEALNLSPKAKKQIEQEAKKHIEKNFSITKMQQSTINLYKELLND